MAAFPRLLQTAAEVRPWLQRDRRWAAYALADLEEPFWSHSAFWVTDRPSPAVLLHLSLSSWELIWADGSPSGVDAILAALPVLPVAVNLMLPAAALTPFDQWYEYDPVDHMCRLVLTRDSFQAVAGERAERLRDPEELGAFYAGRAPGYDPAQVERGIYYGIRDPRGRLLSAAGTHAIAPAEGIGVIGNVFTEPHARGRGLGREVTAAVASEALEAGCREVALNVRRDNVPALAIYSRLGFMFHCDFVETIARLRV